MTPRHTLAAPVALGGIGAVGHGRGRARTTPGPTVGAPLQDRRTADVDDGYRARGRTPPLECRRHLMDGWAADLSGGRGHVVA